MKGRAMMSPEFEKLLSDTEKRLNSFILPQDCKKKSSKEEWFVQKMEILLNEFNPKHTIKEGKFIVNLKKENNEFRSEPCDTLLKAYEEAIVWHKKILNKELENLEIIMKSKGIYGKSI